MVTGTQRRSAFRSPAQGPSSVLGRSWDLHLAAENKRPHTREIYSRSVKALGDFLKRQGMPTEITAIRREHAEAFLSHVLDTGAAATAATRHNAFRQFFGWLVEEGELPTSPMARSISSASRRCRRRC